ncbi:TPA: hypothetical protein U1C15_001908 [Streptococcus suis]|nr:hypothetical protein [Streptococcus suis]
MSEKDRPYGTEYKTVHKVSNIKFVIQNDDGSQVAPLETMTNGRIYVLVDKYKNSLKSITYYDENNKRSKQIDLDHEHKKMQPHTHHGYHHAEYEISNKGATKLLTKEKNMVDRVMEEWYNYIKQRKG